MIVEARNLVNALTLAKRTLSHRRSLPILRAVRLSSLPEGRATLESTDLEMGMRAEFDIETNGGDAECCVIPAALLGDIVRGGCDKTLRIETSDGSDRIAVRNGMATLTSLGMAAEEWPIIPPLSEPGEWTPAGDFLAAAKSVLPAMGWNDTRPILRGVCWDGQEVAATDTHRVMICTIDPSRAPAQSRGEALPPHKIVPKRALDVVFASAGKHRDQVQMRFSELHAEFSIPGQWTFTTRLIEGKFPNYPVIMPHGESWTLIMRTDELRDALAWVAPMARECSQRTTWDREDGDVRIRSDHRSEGEAEAVVNAQIVGEMPKLAVDCSYVYDVVDVLHDCDTICMRGYPDKVVNDMHSPLPFSLLSEDRPGWLSVLMPMGLEDGGS